MCCIFAMRGAGLYSAHNRMCKAHIVTVAHSAVALPPSILVARAVDYRAVGFAGLVPIKIYSSIQLVSSKFQGFGSKMSKT